MTINPGRTHVTISWNLSKRQRIRWGIDLKSPKGEKKITSTIDQDENIAFDPEVRIESTSGK
jgi:hypothetical protein